jgi:hypothetical protein
MVPSEQSWIPVSKQGFFCLNNMSEYQPKLWTIEQPTPKDAEPIARLYAESWQVTYARPGQDERNRQVENDAAAILTPDRLARRRGIIANLDNHRGRKDSTGKWVLLPPKIRIYLTII